MICCKHSPIKFTINYHWRLLTSGTLNKSTNIDVPHGAISLTLRDQSKNLTLLLFHVNQPVNTPSKYCRRY